MRESRVLNQRDVDVGKRLYELGMSMHDFRFSDGCPPSLPEMKALHQRCYPHGVYETGRKSTVDRVGTVVHGDYECTTCLAGSVYLASPEGFYGKIPIVLPDNRCVTRGCQGRSTLKSGGGYDGIVIVLPHNDIHNVFVGEWPVSVLGTMRSWSDDYLYAVRASDVFSTSASLGKVNATYGERFRTKSRFQEAIMFLCRMRGIQDAAFYHCRDNPSLYEQLEIGRAGAIESMRAYFAATIETRVNRMTHYAWGLYELCKYSAEYPEVQIPLTWFCANMNRVSRHTRKAVLSMKQEYDRLKSLAVDASARLGFSEKLPIEEEVVCADCQLHYGATEITGLGIGVVVSDQQLLRASANLVRLEPDVRRVRAFRLHVARPDCMCLLGSDDDSEAVDTPG